MDDAGNKVRESIAELRHLGRTRSACLLSNPDGVPAPSERHQQVRRHVCRARSAWDRACEKTGTEDLNINDLRGRASVDALQADSIEAGRALLGHKTQRTTSQDTDAKFVPRVMPACRRN